LDKGPPLLHPSGPPLPFPPLNHHHDPLLMNRNSSLFHPLPLHALPGGPKPPGTGTTGPPALNFPSPFGPSPHDNAALRHLDPLGLRLMNPAAAAAAAQLFAAQSHYNASVGRPTPGSFDPTTAALLLDPRYRSMIPPFGNSSPSSSVPPSPSNNSSSSANAAANSTHNHSHIHSHSHTHLHLSNNNDSSSSPSNNSNGPTIPPPPPPPPPMMPFPNPLSSKFFFQQINLNIIFI
jgi:hypothetical protein